MATDAAKGAAVEPSDEEGDVLVWRLEQFHALGFNAVEAASLAESEADLGRARWLCKAGCPNDLATRILL
jgi:hypothetical protein